MKFRTTIIMVHLIFVTFTAISQTRVFTEQQKTEQCQWIKEALRHSWQGYKDHAWGMDVLSPISQYGRNWYNYSMMMTPVDAFDTFLLLDMKEEAQEAKDLIFTSLTFDVDQEVQLFEISIRVLGGLISAYEQDGDERFLQLAVDLGARLIPAFNSATGMPYRFVNLKTENTRDPMSNPAEIGTYLLEFGKLTQLTGDSTYYQTAKRAAMEVFNRRSGIDLVGTVIDVGTGEWKNTESQVGAGIDSYYEYLFKAWKLFGDNDCKRAWEVSEKAVKKNLLSKTPNGSFFIRADMNSGKETRPLYGALEAFYAGLLALSGDIETARSVQQANYYMWTKFKMEPEEFDFKTEKITDPAYRLRPENIESCFYLYRMTKDDNYLWMGKRMIDDILKKCRTEVGFAGLTDARTMKHFDSMESFFLAETLKYAYLLFAQETTLDLNKFVFSTEAHPLKIM